MDFIFESILGGLFIAWILGLFGLYEILEKVINSMCNTFKFEEEHYYLAFIVLSLICNFVFAYTTGGFSIKMSIG